MVQRDVAEIYIPVAAMRYQVNCIDVALRGQCVANDLQAVVVTVDSDNFESAIR